MTTEQPQVTGHAHRRDSLSDILGKYMLLPRAALSTD